MQMTKDKDDQQETATCCSGLSELLSPQLFKALSDPKRLELLVRVAEGGGPNTVTGVAKGSGIDMSVVSRHLAILREAGVIKCEKRGKEVLCTLQADVIVRILRQLADALESCCGKGAQEGPTGEASSVRENRSSRKQK